jgi:large subunit ribosomal protein L18
MNTFKTYQRKKKERRLRRIRRVKKDIFGTPQRPRLCVFRSNKHFYAQIVDDQEGKTLVSANTLMEGIKSRFRHGGNIDAARVVGESIARVAIEKGIDKVCFDKRWYKYHGRVKAFAQAARQAGLRF